MLLTDRCQVMLPNSCQCPNPVVDSNFAPDEMDTTKCLLHNQLDTPANDNQVVDETTQRANSIPINNTGE